MQDFKFAVLALAFGTMLMVPPITLALDPNCQVNVVQGGAINNYPGQPNAKQNINARDAFNRLDFANIWRGAGTIANVDAVRLDQQGLTATHSNLQAQLNGVRGNSTIAHALVARTLETASTADRQTYVKKQVMGALYDSLVNGNSYTVRGQCN